MRTNTTATMQNPFSVPACPFFDDLGIEKQTTFWEDFLIAYRFGRTAKQKVNAIRDTYRRAFNAWKEDVVYMAELSLVLNWLIWTLYRRDEPTARVFNELWHQNHDYCREHFQGSDAEYYFRMTD